MLLLIPNRTFCSFRHHMPPDQVRLVKSWSWLVTDGSTRNSGLTNLDRLTCQKKYDWVFTVCITLARWGPWLDIEGYEDSTRHGFWLAYFDFGYRNEPCCTLLCALLTHFKVFIKQSVRGILVQIIVQLPASVLGQVWCFNVLSAPPPVLKLSTDDRRQA